MYNSTHYKITKRLKPMRLYFTDHFVFKISSETKLIMLRFQLAMSAV